MVDVIGTTVYIDGDADNLFSIDIYCRGEDGKTKEKYIIRPDDKVYLHVFDYKSDKDIICIKGPNFLITRGILSEVKPGTYEYYVTLEPGDSELQFRVTDKGPFIIRDGHCHRYTHGCGGDYYMALRNDYNRTGAVSITDQMNIIEEYPQRYGDLVGYFSLPLTNIEFKNEDRKVYWRVVGSSQWKVLFDLDDNINKG